MTYHLTAPSTQGGWDEPEVLAFYGPDHLLSNMYMYNRFGGFWSAEHDFQLFKANFFEDYEIAKLIESTACPKKVKKLGKSVKGFNQIDWDNTKLDQMRLALGNKAAHCKMFRYVLHTAHRQGRTFAEASPRDTYWGTGYGKEKTEAGESRGQNMLGKLLTELAEEITHREY